MIIGNQLPSEYVRYVFITVVISGADIKQIIIGPVKLHLMTVYNATIVLIILFIVLIIIVYAVFQPYFLHISKINK